MNPTPPEVFSNPSKMYIHLRVRNGNAFFIKGNEGTPEIFGKCAVTIVENGETEEIKVDPKEYGIDYLKSTQPISLQDSLAQTGDPSDSLLELAKFNAAVLFYLSSRSPTIEDTLNKLS